MSQSRILIMAGGTGGHVIPALSVAKKLKQEGWSIRWLGTKEGFEAEAVPKNNFPISYLTVTGLRGKNSLTQLMAPFRLAIALYQSIKVILNFKPNVVLGMGGFASGPGGVAAWLFQKPLVIHEQNAIPGTTNKILGRLANRVLQAFPGTFPEKYHAHLTGNPIREELLKVPLPQIRFKDRTGPLRILVLGGSQGAKALNELCPKMIQLISLSNRPDIWHQTGTNFFEATRHDYRKVSVDARVEPFITDMAAAYEWADIVICRAGALTVSELSAVGVGSILVPFPFAVDDHQMHNGRFLERVGGAFLFRQDILSPQVLADKIVSLSKDRSKVLKMAEAAKGALLTDALARVTAYCKEVARGTQK